MMITMNKKNLIAIIMMINMITKTILISMTFITSVSECPWHFPYNSRGTKRCSNYPGTSENIFCRMEASGT